MLQRVEDDSLLSATNAMITQCGAWSAIFNILEGSKHTRDQIIFPACTFTTEHRQFAISAATNETEVRECHAVFSSVLKATELEDQDTFVRNTVHGVMVGDKRCRYKVFCIRDDETGAVIAAHAGVLVGLDTEGTAVFIGTYAATNPIFGNGGLMRQLLASSLMQAAYDAHARDETLVSIIGDCTSSSERTWNQTGRSRIYIPDGVDPKIYQEVQFQQASLRFDVNGLPTGDAGVVSEHLMARVFVGTGLSREMISDAVKATYAWCEGQWDPNYFSNTAAYKVFLGHFHGLMSRFNEQLRGGNEPLFLFTQTRRNAMIDNDGYKFRGEE